MGAGIVEQLVEGGNIKFHRVSFAKWALPACGDRAGMALLTG
jgi:hypothetical protein